MKKLNILLGALLGTFLFFTSVQAGSFGLGVTGNIASVSADGTETLNKSNTGTENSVMSATAGNQFVYGSIYAEYGFGDSEMITLGVAHVPYSADINSKTLSRTDASDTGSLYTAVQSGTIKSNAEIDNHTTYYLELGAPGGEGIYGKIGYAQVDINVKQTTPTNYGSYPNKTLDAITYGVGYKRGFGDNGVYKIEGYFTDYDDYSATSTSSNTVKANLDLVGAQFAVGFKF
jgi:hypothetical protein